MAQVPAAGEAGRPAPSDRLAVIDFAPGTLEQSRYRPAAPILPSPKHGDLPLLFTLVDAAPDEAQRAGVLTRLLDNPEVIKQVLSEDKLDEVLALLEQSLDGPRRRDALLVDRSAVICRGSRRDPRRWCVRVRSRGRSLRFASDDNFGQRR